jgi:hypothetical protein
MKPRLLLACFCLTLAGCAGMTADQCRGADWYDIAFRDAIFGLQPQDELYEAQCSPHGARPDRGRYREGWINGHHELFKRQTQSVD